MRILCAYSGLEFNVQFFPGTLYTRAACHPVFLLEQHKLLSYTPKWGAGQLTDTDTYLLYLALLNSTRLIEWRVAAQQTKATMIQINNTMEQLIQVIGKLNLIRSPSLALPRFVISPDTRTLTNCHYWLHSWEEAYKAWNDGYRSVSLTEKIRRREYALEKLIKNSQKQVTTYAHILADWASLTGDFPTGTTLVAGKQIPLNEYWKQIIRDAASDIKLIGIPPEDLKELIEHCYTTIPNGTIFSHKLFSFLKDALEKTSNPLGIGDTMFRILDAEVSVEDANKLAIIDTAPLNEPKQEQYPSKFLFIKAKLAWQLASKYREGLQQHAEDLLKKEQKGEMK